MEVFEAGVQYNDWKGTAAADEGHDPWFRALLLTKGLIDDKSFVVAIKFYSGESFDKPWIQAVIADGTGYDDVNTQITSADTLRFKEVDVELSLDEFFGVFKRFNIVLTSRDLGLDGREYEVVES